MIRAANARTIARTPKMMVWVVWMFAWCKLLEVGRRTLLVDVAVGTKMECAIVVVVLTR